MEYLVFKKEIVRSTQPYAVKPCSASSVTLGNQWLISEVNEEFIGHPAAASNIDEIFLINMKLRQLDGGIHFGVLDNAEPSLFHDDILVCSEACQNL